MKKYNIEVDCANCANLVEGKINELPEIASCTISFMTQKMNIEFAENVNEKDALDKILKVAKKVEPDFEILD